MMPCTRASSFAKGAFMLAHRIPIWCSVVALTVASSLASATAQRTFVASTGVDNPNCQIATPCRNFAAAITATSSNGEIIAQDSAGYGPVTITKSVSIIAPPGIYAGISVLSGDGVTVNAGTSDTVILRGLTINSQGGNSGITITSAGTVQVEDCVINGMKDGIEFVPDTTITLIVSGTTIRNSHGVAIFAVALSGGQLSKLEVWRDDINQNAGGGILINDLTRVSIGDTIVADSLIGIGVQASSLSTVDPSVVIDRTQIVGNSFYGLEVSGTGSVTSSVNVSQSVISNNGIGIYASPGHVRLSGNQITGNTTGTTTLGAGVIESMRNNLRKGNGTDGGAAVGITPF
jgi:hypothetical protein